MSENTVKTVNSQNTVNQTSQDDTNIQNQSPVQIKFQEFQPCVDIEENKEDYVVSVDMPGLNPADIEVKLDKEILTVEAASEIEGLAPRHYFRQFRVMRGLDADKCRADYKQGVLTLRLAKPTTAKPQQIRITCE